MCVCVWIFCSVCNLIQSAATYIIPIECNMGHHFYDKTLPSLSKILLCDQMMIDFFLIKMYLWPVVVMHTFNPRIGQAEVSESLCV